jgi:hypothetical protein
MATFTQRIVGTAKLHTSAFEEVEHDPGALKQAMFVVVLANVAAGIGYGGGRPGGFLIGIIVALLGWFIWAGLTYFIGTRLLSTPQTHADWGQLLRTTGFSAAPGMLRIFSPIPLLGNLIVGIANVWMLVSFIVAVRQALDYESTWRAVGVCVIGWFVYAILIRILLF